MNWSCGQGIDDCDEGHMSGRMREQVELEWWERECWMKDEFFKGRREQVES